MYFPIDRNNSANLFTIDLQVFVNKTMMFLGFVEDIEEDDDRFYIKFLSVMNKKFFDPVLAEYILKTSDKDLLKMLLKNRKTKQGYRAG